MLKPVSMKPKIGRNDPCPCGSGNKYKRCCMHARPASQVAIPVGPIVHSEILVPDQLPASREANEAAGASRRSADVSHAETTPSPTDLAETESSLLVHLELYSWLGDEAAMATAYGCLAHLYEDLGDLAAATAMHEQASMLRASLVLPT